MLVLWPYSYEYSTGSYIIYRSWREAAKMLVKIHKAVNISARRARSLSAPNKAVICRHNRAVLSARNSLKDAGAKSGERKRINEIQKQAELATDADRLALLERLVTLCERLLKLRLMQPRTPATQSKKPIHENDRSGLVSCKHSILFAPWKKK